MVNGDGLGGEAAKPRARKPTLTERMTADGALEDTGDGEVSAVAAETRDALARLRETVAGLSDHATAAIAAIGERARSLYANTAGGARRVGERVDPFVHERPYAGMAVAATAGFVVGVLIAGAASRAVYVRRRL